MSYPPAPGQQQSSPPPNYPDRPMQPPKKRKKWPWIVGGLVLLSIVGCIGVFTLFVGGAAKVATDMDSNQKGKNATVGEMGKPAKDGKFQFTVTGMKCGVDRVGSSGLGQKAQGEFCLIDVRVKNIADTAEIFNDSSQQATDAKGATYSVDSGAAIYANGENSTFLEQINPGNTVKGKLAFDVPPGTKLSAVVLHESMFTAGVKIPLK